MGCEETAETIARAIRRGRFERNGTMLKAYDPDCPLTDGELADARTAIAAVAPLIEAQARAAAIEEAAKVADEKCFNPPSTAFEEGYSCASLEIAEAIRALAARPVSERQEGEA